MSSYRRADKLHCMNIPEPMDDFDTPPKMLLPRIVSSKPSPRHPYTSLLDAHLEYCLQCESQDPTSLSSSHSSSSSSTSFSDDEHYSSLVASARLDLNTIATAFPSLQSPATILSMAAWYRLLRLVDAALETLLPCACLLDAVVRSDLIDALRRGSRIGVVKAARPNPLENYSSCASWREKVRQSQLSPSAPSRTHEHEDAHHGTENAWGCWESKAGYRGGGGSSNSSSSSTTSSSSTASPSLPSSSPPSPPPQPACCCVPAAAITATTHRLRHLTRTFRTHASALLTPTSRTYRRLLAAICNTWAGYIAEANLRAAITPFSSSSFSSSSSSSSSSLLGTYLAVRERTIGIAPFFVLLEADALPATHVASAALAALERDVTDAAVLQNDLCGLARDILADDELNLAILASGELRAIVAGREARAACGRKSAPGEAFGISVAEAARKGRGGVLRAAALHNRAVAAASRRRDALAAEMEREGCDGEAVVANEVLNFVTTHYRWAADAWAV